MKPLNPSEPSRSRTPKRTNGFLYYVFASLVAAVLFFLVLGPYNVNDLLSLIRGKSMPSTVVKIPDNSSESKDQKKTSSTSNKSETFITPPRDTQIIPQDTIQRKSAKEDERQSQTDQYNLEIIQNQPNPVLYQKYLSELNQFYTHLDQEPYMRVFRLNEPSKIHFSKLLQNLINTPPVVTRETDDIYTLLKNTAHFFNILGKENIIILKGVLDREKNSFESILKAFYYLTSNLDLIKKEYAIDMSEDALYDYAGFFLNTIGGRLYLFRRDSLSRMTMSYYSILVIDRANKRGNSRSGIDLRPAINLLIEEIENTGKALKLKDEYLETLYDLQEYYANR